MSAKLPQAKAKRAMPALHVEVPAELSSHDLRQAALALDDIVEDVLANTLSRGDRHALADVAGWLRKAAKAVDPRDVADWDTVLAVREERDTRGANQLAASKYGVGEATVREASFARQMDRSKRRIVR